MKLNTASGLTKEDFKKVLSGNPEDTNKIFENNDGNIACLYITFKANSVIKVSKPIYITTDLTNKDCYFMEDIEHFPSQSPKMYIEEGTVITPELLLETGLVKKQLDDKDINVFSGKAFDDEQKDTGLDFQDMISIDEEMLSSAFGTKIDEDDISKMTQGYMTEISSAITTDTSKAKSAFIDTLTTLTTDFLNNYIENHFNDKYIDKYVNIYLEIHYNSFLETEV